MFSASEKSSTSPRRWRSSGMWPRPASRHSLAALVGHVLVADTGSCPRSTWRSPASASISSRLAVAVDAGDPDDLAGAHLERDALHRVEAAVVLTVRPSTWSSGSPGATAACRRGAAPRGRPSAAPGLLGRACGGHGLDLLAAPEHGDPVGDLEHLVQLVADEDDRLALRRVRLLTIANSSCASCGVSTAVGSSRTRMSAPR